MRNEFSLRKGFSLLLMLLFFVGVVAGFGPSSVRTAAASTLTPKAGGTLVVGAIGDPQTFNPDARPDDNFYPIAQNIFSRLIKLNDNQEVIPDLAYKWEVSKNGTTITFHLRKNVKWQDGKLFTSADVKFTLDSIMKNNGYIAPDLKSMKKVTTPDKNTVVIQLSHPDATFLGYLAWYGTFILPEHIYGGGHWDKGTTINPVGTGPFKFDQFTPGKDVTLVKNSQYFGHVPYVDKVVFATITDPNTMVQSFYNDQLDILGTSPPSSEVQKMETDPSIVAKPVLWPSRDYLVFNFAKKPFNNLKVREAVAYALNNQEIVTQAMKGQGQASKYFLSPVYKWALSNKYTVPKYDPTRAENLLKQAGYTKGKNGYYLSITFDVFQVEPFPDMATVIQSELRKAGINVTLNVMDFAAWQQKVTQAHNFEMSMLGGYQGPDVGAVGLRVATGAPNNFMGYSNKKLDQDLLKGSELASEKERAPYYIDAQRILSTDLPIYPVSEYISIDPYHSYVEGTPDSAAAIGHTGFSEYNYVWLNH